MEKVNQVNDKEFKESHVITVGQLRKLLKPYKNDVPLSFWTGAHMCMWAEPLLVIEDDQDVNIGCDCVIIGKKPTHRIL